MRALFVSLLFSLLTIPTAGHAQGINGSSDCPPIAISPFVLWSHDNSPVIDSHVYKSNDNLYLNGYPQKGGTTSQNPCQHNSLNPYNFDPFHGNNHRGIWEDDPAKPRLHLLLGAASYGSSETSDAVLLEALDELKNIMTTLLEGPDGPTSMKNYLDRESATETSDASKVLSRARYIKALLDAKNALQHAKGDQK